jgi:cobalamin biosynthetic protein CobC
MDLSHGGNVGAAAEQFDIPAARWIDMSTGISPWSWPVPDVPQTVWQSLPPAVDQLERVAAQYYGCPAQAILAVPGSQYALQYTPALLRHGTVAIPLRGYAEHHTAWLKAGHKIIQYTDIASLQKLVSTAAVDHVVVINPNNPTAEHFTRRELLALHELLQQKDGFLVVDEAFADGNPDECLSQLCPQPGLVVYRSVGKFFGLAGIRLGFLLASADLCQALRSSLPPWLVSYPAQWIGTAALADRDWQALQRERLERAGKSWLQMLQQSVPRLEFTGVHLFVTGEGDAAYCRALFQAFGRRALLVRIFEEIEGRSILRFGLPTEAIQQQVERLIVESVEECECAIG